MATDKELHGLCERIVVELISHRGWRLLEKDDFVSVVYERTKVEGKQTESDITKIAINEYCKALHEACSPPKHPEDPHRLNQAYEELSRYLCNIAYNWRPDQPEDAKDAAQKALLDIYQALIDDKCREPGAFLAFSIGKLRGALTWVNRQKEKVGPVSLEYLFTTGTQDDESTSAWEPKLREEFSMSPEEETERRLLAEAIWAELQRKFQKHPRATQQLEAVIMKHSLGYKNQEIANSLGVASAEAVYSLLSRGKKKLADNQEFKGLSIQMLCE